MGIYKNYQIKWWGFSQWFGDWFHQHFSMGNSNKRPGGLEPRGESKWDMGWYGISTARSWKFGVKKWGNTHFSRLLSENNGSWTFKIIIRKAMINSAGLKQGPCFQTNPPPLCVYRQVQILVRVPNFFWHAIADFLAEQIQALSVAKWQRFR